MVAMSKTCIVARAKAFSTESARKYKFCVDDSGYVTVYDDIAGHYTVVHSMSAKTKRRIRKLARGR
jgi:hypothetical protein